MLDQNTDRMWYVIGAVLVGAAIILIANGTLPELFASVTGSFENVSNNATSGVKSIVSNDRRVGSGNLIRNYNFSDGLRYWVVGPSGATSDVLLELMYDDNHDNIVKVTANEFETGMYYRESDDKDVLTEGNAYEMRVLMRADEEIEIGLAFDGHVLERSKSVIVGQDWEWVSLIQESEGTNTRPRIYAVEGGTYYIAEVELFDYIIEEGEVE